MPPVNQFAVPESGQTTLDFTGRYIAPRVGRKPKANAPRYLKGDVPRLPHQSFTGSTQEATLIRQFETARIVHYDDEASDPNSIARHRNSYPRELKLSAVYYTLNTYKKGKKDGDPPTLITKYEAAKKIGITETMLKNWIKNRDIIAGQRKGSRRGRHSINKGKEDALEVALYKEFEEARAIGRQIGSY